MWTSLLRHGRAIPRRFLLNATAGAAIAAVALIAGGSLGSAALLLCVPAGVAFALWRSREQARQAGMMHLSHVDPLTGLGSPMLLRRTLAYEMTRHHRHQRRLSVVVIGVEGLNRVGGRFGPVAGDEVRRAIARQLERAVRDEDTVVRLGDSEFCVLSPETGWREIELVADRLRAIVRQVVTGIEGCTPTTGFAIFPEEGATPEVLLSRARAVRAPGAVPARPQLRSVHQAAS
jgi:diguanylate cyclase (GGDEF)-like protein